MICVHNYLRKCETGSMPPGIVDFLRGTVALFNYSKKYNYTLLINRTIHPVFKYFKNSHHYIDMNNNTNNTFELLSQANPLFIDHIIERLFQNGNNIFIITNCLLEQKHILTDDCKIFLKTILTPSEILFNRLYNVYINIGLIGIGNIDYIPNYYCIHIRFGDTFINKENFTENDQNIINIIDPTIKNILEHTDNKNNPIILLSDSSIMAKEVKRINKDLLYWDNKKIHLGNLITSNNKEENEENIIDTLIDLIILSKSQKIFTFNISKQYKTTFSPFIAQIYDIENVLFQLL